MIPQHLPSLLSSTFYAFQNTCQKGIKAMSVGASVSKDVFKYVHVGPSIGVKGSVFVAVLVIGLLGIAATVAALFSAIWYIAKKDKSESSAEKDCAEKVVIELTAEEQQQVARKSNENSVVVDVFPEALKEIDKEIPSNSVEEKSLMNNLPIPRKFVVKKPPANRNRVLPSTPSNIQSSVLRENLKPNIEVILKLPEHSPQVVNVANRNIPSIPARSIKPFSNSQQMVISSNAGIREARRPIPGRRRPTKIGKWMINSLDV
jgi:hypothetical protein